MQGTFHRGLSFSVNEFLKKLMNVINKNENGKLHQITTYIGIEGHGFVCAGNANDQDAPETIFSYQTYVREREAMLPE